MPFLAQTTSLTRYRLSDEPPKSLWGEVLERLRKNAFQDIDATAEERSFGWVCFDDWLDPAFDAAPPEKGAYLAFSLRLDTRRVAPAVFKKYYQLALRQALAAVDDESKRFLSKDRKRELREQVALKLRARSLPVPAVFEVVWNTRDGLIWLASTNSKVRALFEDCFQQTFGLSLEPQAPFFLAGRLLGEDAVSRLEALEPSDFAG